MWHENRVPEPGALPRGEAETEGNSLQEAKKEQAVCKV